MNRAHSALFLLLFLGFGNCEDYLIEREISSCKLDGQVFTEGQIHTLNDCVDVCLCEDDAKFHCRSCKPQKPDNKCNGWAHELIKIDFYVGSHGAGCKCFKYECHKKSIKTLFKELWGKLKSKVRKVVHGKDTKSDNVVQEE